MSRSSTILASVLAIAGLAGGQGCGPNGLVMTTAGGRLGDSWGLALSGPPSASGLIGIDLVGGPVATPIGSICLGLTPALQTTPFTLDATGNFGASGTVPLDPSVTGMDVFLQAAAPHAGGFVTSNGVRVALRPPRVYAVYPGYAGLGGGAPGAWTAFDVLTGTFGPIHNLTGAVLAELAYPELGAIIFLFANAIVVMDGTTGATLSTIPLNPLISAFSPARLYRDGNVVMVAEFPGFGQSYTRLRILNLASGALQGYLVFPSILPVNGFVMAPGSAFAYAERSSQGTLTPIVLATGALLPSIATGGAYGRWIAGGNKLYGLIQAGFAGDGLNVLDPSTNTFLFPAPVLISFFASQADDLFKFGPGSTGFSIFVRNPSTSTLVEFSPQTLTATGPPIPIPSGTLTMAATNGASEWILLEDPPCAPTSCGATQTETVHVMNPVSHAMTLIGTFQTGRKNVVLPMSSASFNKAFLGATEFAPTLVPVDTDPTTTLMPPIPLPTFPTNTTRFVVD